MMVRFENINWLLLLTLVPIFIGLLHYFYWAKIKLLAKWKNKDVLEKIAGKLDQSYPLKKMILGSCVFLLLVLALANPQWGKQSESLHSSASDIYLAIDISKSMDATDVAPSRMIKAKKYLTQLIENNKGNNFAIILFAGSSFLQMPLTNDYAAAIMMINAVNTSYAGSQGTDIESALMLLEPLIEKSNNKNAIIVFITDGEDHESLDLSIEENLVKQGVKVYCIAAGTAEGGKIPEGNGYKKDEEGNDVISKVNEALINDIAKKGNGKAYDVNDVQSLQHLKKEIEQALKVEASGKSITHYRSYFQWILSVVLILLMSEYLMPFIKRFRK